MTRRISLLVSALILAAVSSALAGTDGSFSVLDRTFRCTPTALADGSRVTDVIAVPVRAVEAGASDPFQAPSPGFIGITSGSYGPDADLVSVRARLWQRFGHAYIFEGVYASAGRCSASRASAPLSAAGFSKPPLRWAEQVTCTSEGPLIVRVRATLQSAGRWQRLGSVLEGVRRKVVEAAIVVRSEERGTALAYMELDRGGKTKLWHAPSCT